ncbi:MAG TPA: hypothetical protein VHH88_00990 [Verrucomicrobiae bacterium]|nr:hypothetical protein [Verrucomicrobiae bacterium]
MKISARITVILAALGLFCASAAHAQVLTLGLTLTAPGSSTNRGAITTTAKPIRVKLGTKELLIRLNNDHGLTNDLTDAQLVFTNGAFAVLDRQHAIIDSASELGLAPASDIAVISGTSNAVSASLFIMQKMTLSFDDSSSTNTALPLTFTASGIFTNHTTITPPNRNGQRTRTQSISGTVAGSGAAGVLPVIVTGSLHETAKDFLTPGN